MIEAQRGLSPRPITPLEIGIGNGNTSTLATLESEETAHIMRISFVEKETTMTTDKNNFFYGGQHARRSGTPRSCAARKKKLFLRVVSVVSRYMWGLSPHCKCHKYQVS